MKKIDLSIIIVSWNGKDVIEKCLSSILKTKHNFSYEVIVVDNNSNDKTLKILNKYKSKIKIMKNKKNRGFSRANNQGIKLAGGEYVLLLNQDIVIQNKAIGKMLDFFKKGKKLKEKVGAVSPALFYPNGKIQKSLRKLPTPINIIIDAVTLGYWHEKQYNYSTSQIVEQPMASCLMIRSKILKKIKGFDENPNFFLYFNDVDLSKRIKEMGYEHYYLSKAKAIHHHGESTKRLKSIARIKLWCDGLYYFLAKHYAKGKPIKRIFLKIEVGLIFLARIIQVSILKLSSYKIEEKKHKNN